MPVRVTVILNLSIPGSHHLVCKYPLSPLVTTSSLRWTRPRWLHYSYMMNSHDNVDLNNTEIGHWRHHHSFFSRSFTSYNVINQIKIWYYCCFRYWTFISEYGHLIWWCSCQQNDKLSFFSFIGPSLLSCWMISFYPYLRWRALHYSSYNAILDFACCYIVNIYSCIHTLRQSNCIILVVFELLQQISQQQYPVC